MLMLVAPLSVALFYCITVQHARGNRVLFSQDLTKVCTKTKVSFWGQDYQDLLVVSDMVTGHQLGKMVTKSIRKTHIDDFGRVLYLDEQNREWLWDPVGGKTRRLDIPWYPPDRQQNLNPLDLNWIDRKTLVYEDTQGLFRRYDIDTQESSLVRWARPTNETFSYWDSNDNLISVDKASGTHSYHLVDDRLEFIGKSSDAPFRSFFPGGERRVRASKDLLSCQVVDVASGEVELELEATRTNVCVWRAEGEYVTCYYCWGVDLQNPTIIHAEFYDAQSGELGHEVSMQEKIDDIRFAPKANRIVVTSPDQSVVLLNLDGTKAVMSSDPIPWRWPARIVCFLLAGTWWLIWSLRLRQGKRSYQVFYDLAILHLIGAVCTGARLWAYTSGPDWGGAMHVLESVAFLGINGSIVTLTIFWLVHGSHRWSTRIGIGVLAAAALFSGIILLWDAGSRGNDRSLARAQTVIGTTATALMITGLFATSWVSGIRLRHTTDDVTSRPPKSQSQISIRALAGWMICFGVLFTIVKLRSFPVPNNDNLIELVTNGSAGGLAACLTVWLVLGRTRWRLPICIMGYGLVIFQYYRTQRLDVMEVGWALIPMLLVAAMALRWNGYRLSSAQQT